MVIAIIEHAMHQKEGHLIPTAPIKKLPGRYYLFLLTVIYAFGIFGTVQATDQEKTIYAVYWRGCDELCEGFQEYIRDSNINAKIISRDAESDKTRLPGYLEEARKLDVDLILTWGTSVTLGIAGTVDDVDNPQFNNEIPQVFTNVADPVGARIVESLEKTGRSNITGTFNRVPETVNISAIRSYLPGFKRLGILYNTNERNSVLKQQEVSELSGQLGFELVALPLDMNDEGLPVAEDIPVKIKMLKEQEVDFIYLGSSTFLNTNHDSFTGSAIEHGIPVLSPYEHLVRDSQALLSIAARYSEIGRLAGQQAEKILQAGAVPGDMPVVRMTRFAYVVNMEVARKLNLFPSVEILQLAETIH